MKNIRVFLSENFQFLEVQFSMYLNRHVFIMQRLFKNTFCKQLRPTFISERGIWSMSALRAIALAIYTNLNLTDSSSFKFLETGIKCKQYLLTNDLHLNTKCDADNNPTPSLEKCYMCLTLCDFNRRKDSESAIKWLIMRKRTELILMRVY